MKKLQLEEILNQFNDQLKNFIKARVKNEALAEDILHEVYLKIHAGLDSVKRPEKIKSWLFQITRNAIIDHFRSKKNNESISENTLFVEDNFDIDPHKKIQASILEMIKQMPEKYRDALILTEYRGLSQKELAEKFGITYSAAKSRVQRARLLLKNMLFQCCHFEFDKYGKIIDYHEITCCDRDHR
ncbi:MAG: RNA polymerase sigma factor SigZ [Calditrichaeota bacterium]|nr:RNA polymerase sigma factor SigZ [Calditrichota bacterium]